MLGILLFFLATIVSVSAQQTITYVQNYTYSPGSLNAPVGQTHNPIFDDPDSPSVVYVVRFNQTVSAYSLTTRTLIWQSQNVSVGGFGAYYGGVIYFDVANNVVMGVNVTSNATVATFTGHTGSLMQITANQNYLVTNAADRTTRSWNRTTGQQVGIITVYQNFAATLDANDTIWTTDDSGAFGKYKITGTNLFRVPTGCANTAVMPTYIGVYANMIVIPCGYTYVFVRDQNCGNLIYNLTSGSGNRQIGAYTYQNQFWVSAYTAQISHFSLSSGTLLDYGNTNYDNQAWGLAYDPTRKLLHVAQRGAVYANSAPWLSAPITPINFTASCPVSSTTSMSTSSAAPSSSSVVMTSSAAPSSSSVASSSVMAVSASSSAQSSATSSVAAQSSTSSSVATSVASSALPTASSSISSTTIASSSSSAVWTDGASSSSSIVSTSAASSSSSAVSTAGASSSSSTVATSGVSSSTSAVSTSGSSSSSSSISSTTVASSSSSVVSASAASSLSSVVSTSAATSSSGANQSSGSSTNVVSPTNVSGGAEQSNSSTTIIAAAAGAGASAVIGASIAFWLFMKRRPRRLTLKSMHPRPGDLNLTLNPDAMTYQELMSGTTYSMLSSVAQNATYMTSIAPGNTFTFAVRPDETESTLPIP